LAEASAFRKFRGIHVSSRPIFVVPELESSMVFLLHRCSQVAEAIFAARVERITSRQLEVLVIVRRNPGVSQADICQLSGIDRSTLSDVVGRLISHGLLMRQRHADDARQYEVRPTERGLDLLERLMPELDN